MGKRARVAGILGLAWLCMGSAMAADVQPDLTIEDVMFRYLVAEFASQAGDVTLAGQTLYDLAVQTRDPRLAKMAAQMKVNGGGGQVLSVPALKLWHELDPKAQQPVNLLGIVLASSGKLEEAKPWLKQSLAAQPSQAGNALITLNAVLSGNKDHAKVLAMMTELAAPYAGNADVHVALAQAAWLAEQYSRVISEAGKALAIKQDDATAAQLKGLALQKQSSTEAEAFYQQFLAANPAVAEVRLAYARLLITTDHPEKARDQLTRLLQGKMANPDVPFAAGLLALQLKDGTLAGDAFGKALADGYNDQDSARLYLGEAAELAKNYDQANLWYRQAEATHPFEAKLHEAELLAAQGKRADALAMVRGLKTANDEQWTDKVLAESKLLRDAHDYKGAYAALSAALVQKPDNPQVLYEHALTADQLNREDVLEKDLRHLLKLEPNSPMALNALGYTLADKTNRYDEAYKLLSRAIKLSPDDPLIKDSYGWVEYRLGHLEDSARYLRDAWNATRDAEVGAHLGEVLWKQGKKAEALDILHQAQKLHPDAEQPANVLKRIEKL